MAASSVQVLCRYQGHMTARLQIFYRNITEAENGYWRRFSGAARGNKPGRFWLHRAAGVATFRLRHTRANINKLRFYGGHRIGGIRRSFFSTLHNINGSE